MNRFAIPLLTLSLSLISILSWADEPNLETTKPTAETENTGGIATVDKQNPVKSVIVALQGKHFTDVTMKHLRGLTNLQSLNLAGARVTNAGLKHLKGLTQLQELNLSNTRVTDAGLKHLEGLTELQELQLAGTKVTDAGLQQLKTLTKLRSLNLRRTQVTDAGVQGLQQALPKCKIGD